MRHWKIIGAVVALLGEGALQLSGFTAPLLAILLGLICVGLISWSAWPTIKWIRFQTPIRLISRQGETKTETGSSKAEKKPHIFRSLLMLSDQYTHKCSQCGFGIVVNKYDMGVVCPKCGNADDIIPKL